MSILNKLTKTLEVKQKYLLNRNKRITNDAYSSKPKKIKPSNQVTREKIDKESDNEREIKRQKVKNCKIYGEKYKRDCWQLKTEWFIYYNMGNIAVKYLENSSFGPFSSHNI